MVHYSPFVSLLFWRSQETTLRKNFKIRQYLPISAVKPLIIDPIDLHKKKMKSTTYYKPSDKWSSTKIKQQNMWKQTKKQRRKSLPTARESYIN